MNSNPNFLKVVLDKDATIVEFECTLRDVKVNSFDVIGKNWFDTFINVNDIEKVLITFNDLLNNQTGKWKTYKNDVRCMDGSHKFIDFTNEVIVKDGEKFISSYGVEYLDKI